MFSATFSSAGTNNNNAFYLYVPFKALKDTTHNNNNKNRRQFSANEEKSINKKMQLHGARSLAQNLDSAVLTIQEVKPGRVRQG